MSKKRTWLITGVSSGFGYELTKQLLEQGDTVIGTVRKPEKVMELRLKYPDTFDCRYLELTDAPMIQQTVERAFAAHGTIDVVVSNAGYGLFGCAEEVSEEEIRQIIDTNLIGSILLIRSILPYFRRQRSGRIIQISSYAGQVAFAGNSLYNATKFGIEGFCEAVAKEMAPFGIGVTIVQPGPARTEFRYGSIKVAKLLPEYEGSHSFLKLLDKSKGMAPGDPVRMAARIVESAEIEPAPLHLLFGSQALAATIDCLKGRLTEYEAQAALAASTDYPAEEQEG